MSTRPAVFFVYGTLKRGQERAELWPQTPRSIQDATTIGVLRDLGPYPALVAGNDRIGGELWFFDEADVDETIRTLDAIECCNQGGVDLYERHIVSCLAESGERHEAFIYVYGQPERIAHFPIVAKNEAGLCIWSAELE